MVLGHRETIFKSQQVTTAPVSKESPWREWGSYSNIVAELEVTSAAAGASDTLSVVVQTRIGTLFYDVITFTTVLGNASTPVREAKSATRDNSISWFDDLRVLATPAGGTANFTFTVRIRGS